MKRTILPTIAIGVLTLAGFVSAYQTAFDYWMTAHPVYRSPQWRELFYIRFATTVAIGVAWLLSVVWLIRRRRETKD
jgi:hypothetical protein